MGLISKSSKDNPFRALSPLPLEDAREFARASILRSKACQFVMDLDADDISRNISSYFAPYSS